MELSNGAQHRYLKTTLMLVLSGCAAGPPPATPALTRSLSQECEAGEVHACDTLAELWVAREFPQPWYADEAKRDARLFEKACSGGLGSACVGLAGLVYNGHVEVEEDRRVTVGDGLLRKARDAGEVIPAWLYDTEADHVAAVERAVADCRTGRAYRCGRAAGALWAGYRGVRADRRSALELAEMGCRVGSPGSCVKAQLLTSEADPAASAAWAMRACQRGHPGACSDVARSLEKDDPKGALAGYRHACTLGSATACGNVGSMLERLGAAEQAPQHFEEACERGSSYWCKQLAKIASERGDREKAIGYFTTACRRGDLPACNDLAREHCEGGADEAELAQMRRACAREDSPRLPSSCPSRSGGLVVQVATHDAQDEPPSSYACFAAKRADEAARKLAEQAEHQRKAEEAARGFLADLEIVDGNIRFRGFGTDTPEGTFADHTQFRKPPGLLSPLGALGADGHIRAREVVPADGCDRCKTAGLREALVLEGRVARLVFTAREESTDAAMRAALRARLSDLGAPVDEMLKRVSAGASDRQPQGYLIVAGMPLAKLDDLQSHAKAEIMRIGWSALFGAATQALGGVVSEGIKRGWMAPPRVELAAAATHASPAQQPQPAKECKYTITKELPSSVLLLCSNGTTTSLNLDHGKWYEPGILTTSHASRHEAARLACKCWN